MMLVRVLLCLVPLLALRIPAADAAELTYRGAVVAGADGVPDLYLAAAAVTPDGRHLYATAEEGDGTIAIFERDRETGALTYLDDFHNGDDESIGLTYVRDIVVSRDGLYVYVTTYDGIVRFLRNVGTGALDYKGYTLFGFGVLSGIEYPRSLAISADDRFLYATGGAPGSVTAFARNPETGAIAWIENELDEGIAARHFAGADRIQLSADGKHAYVGSEEDAITLFTIDAVSGALTWAGDVGGTVEALGDIAISPDGARLYVTESSFGAGVFTSWDRDPLTGQLDSAGQTSINPFFPAELAIEPDGSHFFGAGSDRLVCFDTDDETSGFHDVAVENPVLQNGEAGVSSIPFVVDLAMAPDGRHLYAVSNDTEKTIATFATPAYDFLEVNDEGGSAPALDGVSSIAVSRDGKNAYATATAEDAIQVFSRNPTTGALNAVHVARDGIGIVTGLDGARSVIVSPDGKNVYAAGSIADAVVAFTRNPNGQIVFLEKEQNGVGGVAELNNPFALAITRDGKNVYVASSLNYSVSIFARDPATGTLSAGGHFVDGEGGVDGLFLAESIAVSPDGRNVYVGGKGDNEIAIFARDLNIGALSYMGVATGVQSVTGVAVSPDGDFVYAVAFGGDRIVRFARDAATGALGTGVARTHNSGILDGLEGPRGLAMSRDGSRLFVAGEVGNVLAVFERFRDSGSVRLIQAETDDQRTHDALGGIRAIAVSPDGRNVYAANDVDDSIVSFVPEPHAAALAGAALLGVATAAARRRARGRASRAIARG